MPPSHLPKLRTTLLSTTLAILLASPRSARAADSPPASPSGPALLQDLKAFQQMATVLMIAAHPDDENTQLITYLARGRNYRMGYLSITRGDGGQNLLGPEFGDELGLIRTHELLAARQLDSGRQFFTRAIDFGFSKNPEETLKIWDRDQVLADVVRVIRQFRPDVIVTRFAPDGTNTHGHHTASAILGAAAFKISGDARVFPDQLVNGVTPWQPKRIFLNAGAGGGGRGGAGGVVRIDVGGTDPVLNQSFASIASQSRAMHKSQGFGNAGAGGGGGRGGAAGAAQESFQLLDGAPATTDIMDGIDTTWARISGADAPVGSPGKQIAQLTADVIAKFNPNTPAASVPTLLEIKKQIAALPPPALADLIVSEKIHSLDRLIADCLGLSILTTVSAAEIVPGEKIELASAVQYSATIPVTWIATRYTSLGTAITKSHDLTPNSLSTRTDVQTLPANTPVSQPYWLREAPAAGIFRVTDPTLIGHPANPLVLPIEHVFEIAGQLITLSDQPLQLLPTAPAPQRQRPLEVIAPVSLAFPSEVRVFSPGIAKTVSVEITVHRPASTGTLKLNVPAGWSVSPASQPFSLAKDSDHATLTFSVTPPAQAAHATFSAQATIGDKTFSTSRKEILYDHLPFLLLQPPATLKAVSLDLKTAGKSIGYLPGAGDNVAQCIEQMGYKVTQLKPADLTPDTLKTFDAIVLGVRANTRADLIQSAPALTAYVTSGGTVIEQYSRPEQGRQTALSTAPIHLSSLRVTDENATIKFLAPDHPALNTPNKITSADFDNWVQERSIYLPDQWDPAFTPLLAAADPGETPPNSALLIAHPGKGYYIYTSLVFFRQLPAANPGAYRLFANLLSLGKQ